MIRIKRRQYTKEFKQEAVELITKQRYTIAQAANSPASTALCWPEGDGNTSHES